MSQSPAPSLCLRSLFFFLQSHVIMNGIDIQKFLPRVHHALFVQVATVYALSLVRFDMLCSRMLYCFIAGEERQIVISLLSFTHFTPAVILSKFEPTEMSELDPEVVGGSISSTEVSEIFLDFGLG